LSKSLPNTPIMLRCLATDNPQRHSVAVGMVKRGRHCRPDCPSGPAPELRRERRRQPQMSLGHGLSLRSGRATRVPVTCLNQDHGEITHEAHHRLFCNAGLLGARR
jgi:hypothetical protein